MIELQFYKSTIHLSAFPILFPPKRSVQANISFGYTIYISKLCDIWSFRGSNWNWGIMICSSVGFNNISEQRTASIFKVAL
jgi:hypothetical protein